jgi:chlorophyllide reductase iron protein subunit X
MGNSAANTATAVNGSAGATGGHVRRCQADADHRDLRQGRHRQEFHAREPLLHDGAAGQEGAADRLRPEERHHHAAVRRQGLPDHHRDLAKKKAAGDAVTIGDVCFKRDGVFAMELGGPEVGRGCGGRGIIHGFELLESLGFHEWDFDYVLLDFLGDVVCGGFGLPIARDMCQKVIVVGSNDLQSLYVANNVCSAVEYFRGLGGNVGVAGIVINKDDGTGEAQAWAEQVGIPVLAAIPADEDIRRKSAAYQIVGMPGGEWGPLFEELGINVAEAPPMRPKPLSRTGC